MMRDELQEQVAACQQQSLCYIANTQNERRSLTSLCNKNVLTSPFPSYFVTKTYWDKLDHRSQILHIARTYTSAHKDCIFTGLTAADCYQLDHIYASHQGIPIHVLSRTNKTGRLLSPIRRSYCADLTFQNLEGLRVASIERTVVDCCNDLPLREALPIIDSAIRQGISVSDILRYCNTLRRDCTNTLNALHYADPKSENGGESFARGMPRTSEK